jgi:Domain of unknown function (DUF4328)
MSVLRRWSAAAVGLLGTVLASSVVMAVAYWHRISLIDQVTADPTAFTSDQIAASDSFVRDSRLLYLGLFILSGVAFIGWMYVCARSAHRIRGDALRHSAGWAVAGWFIPFLGLFRPPQMANDIWAAPRARGQTRTSTPLVAWWWGLFLVDGALTRVSTSTPSSLDDVRTDAVWNVANAPVDLAAAALAICVVLVLTRRLLAFGGDLGPTDQVAPSWSQAPSEPALHSGPQRAPEFSGPAETAEPSDPEEDRRWERWSRGG